MTQEAFAVELDGKILIRTVSDSEATAQTNGLVLCFGIQPQQHWSNVYVQTVWDSSVTRCATEHRVLIVPVRVERIKGH